MKTTNILDIICTVCIAIITIVIVAIFIYTVIPKEIHVQYWTSPTTGETYYICDLPIIKVDKDNSN